MPFDVVVGPASTLRPGLVSRRLPARPSWPFIERKRVDFCPYTVLSPQRPSAEQSQIIADPITVLGEEHSKVEAALKHS